MRFKEFEHQIQQTHEARMAAQELLQEQRLAQAAQTSSRWPDATTFRDPQSPESFR